MAKFRSLPTCSTEYGQYADKLKILHDKLNNIVDLDPFQMPDEDWIDNISWWPPVEFGQIYTYHIDTPGQFTREKMKAFKSLEAFNYYIRYAWP